MVHDSDGSRKEGSDGEIPGINVKGGGTVGVTLWKQYLGGDRGDSQDPDRVPPSVGATDHDDGGKLWGRQIVEVSSGRRGNGLCGY